MKEALSLWMSVASLLLSIISTCVAVWRSPELGFDYQGVIAGVLSLLVTVLIGWQIYNYVYVNRKLSGVDEMVLSITNDRVKKYGHSVKAFVITLNTMDLYRKNKYEYAIDNFIKAIDEGLDGTDEDGVILPLNYLEDIIKESNNSARLLKDNKHYYLSVLSRLKYEDRRRMVMDFIINAKEA